MRLEYNSPDEQFPLSQRGSDYNPARSSQADHNAAGHHFQRFTKTRWSIVLAVGQADSGESRRALELLCETYRLPVYAYVRRVVARVEDAQDLTQGFFARLLEKDAIAKADPQRGRFRAFLLTSLKNFLENERLKAGAEKRGGGKVALSLDFDSGESRCQLEPSHELTPDRLFERRWVLTLLDLVFEQLRRELVEQGKVAHFEQFKTALTGDPPNADYEQMAQSLGLTPAAAKQAAYRMRKRYRELFRQQVARTVADESEVDDEIRRLLAVLSL